MAWTPLGKMRRRMVIQEITKTPNSDGETIDTVSTFATVWAAIAPLAGREAWIALQQQSTNTHKINCLYVPGVTSRMQGVYAGRTFNFTSVTNVEEMNRELEILATEVMEG